MHIIFKPVEPEICKELFSYSSKFNFYILAKIIFHTFAKPYNIFPFQMTIYIPNYSITKYFNTLTINHPYILSLSLNQQSKTYEIMYKNSFAKIWKNRQISKSISLPSPLIPIFGIYHLLRGRGWILLPLPP